MKSWLLIAAAFLLPGGSLLALIWWAKRVRAEQERADMVPRWAAFIEDEPRIPPAKMPPVKPLRAKKKDSEFLRLLKRRA